MSGPAQFFLLFVKVKHKISIKMGIIYMMCTLKLAKSSVSWCGTRGRFSSNGVPTTVTPKRATAQNTR